VYFEQEHDKYACESQVGEELEGKPSKENMRAFYVVVDVVGSYG
jgi:hypothetical protein